MLLMISVIVKMYKGLILKQMNNINNFCKNNVSFE